MGVHLLNVVFPLNLQHTRMDVLDSFRNGKHHVLVATDIAGRGLDIKTVKTVISYDAAKDIETHVHRVGRTGRAGDKEGVAITLLNKNEVRFASQLVQSFTLAGQPIPPHLYELAMKVRLAISISCQRLKG